MVEEPHSVEPLNQTIMLLADCNIDGFGIIIAVPVAVVESMDSQDDYYRAYSSYGSSGAYSSHSFTTAAPDSSGSNSYSSGTGSSSYSSGGSSTGGSSYGSSSAGSSYTYVYSNPGRVKASIATA
jgi:hypothetical protein